MLPLGAAAPCARGARGVRSGAPHGLPLHSTERRAAISAAVLSQSNEDLGHGFTRRYQQFPVTFRYSEVLRAFPSATAYPDHSSKCHSRSPARLRHLTNGLSNRSRALSCDEWLGRPSHWGQTRVCALVVSSVDTSRRLGGRASTAPDASCASSFSRPLHALALAYRRCLRSRHLLPATQIFLAPPACVSGSSSSKLSPYFVEHPVLPDPPAGLHCLGFGRYQSTVSRPSPSASLETPSLSNPSGRKKTHSEVALSQPLQAPLCFTPSVPYPSDKPVPLDSPLSPSVHAAPQVRRPGSVVRMNEVIRHWWSVPAVGFNGVLEVPIYKFELFRRQEEEPEEGYSRGGQEETQPSEAEEHGDEEGSIGRQQNFEALRSTAAGSLFAHACICG